MLYRKLVVFMSVLFILSGCGIRQLVHQGAGEQTAPAPSAQSVAINNSEAMIVVFIVKPEVVKALVPAPLAPMPYNIMYVAVSRTPLNIGFVQGMELGVAVMYKGKMFNYPVYGVVDHEGFSELGRLTTGSPTRMGQITLEKKDQKVLASVVRNGKTLLKATMVLVEPGEALDSMPVVNLKMIPADTKGAEAAVKQLVTRKLETVKVHEMIDGEATVEFDQSMSDGFPKLQVQQVYRSVYRKADYTATETGVLYDYLKTH